MNKSFLNQKISFEKLNFPFSAMVIAIVALYNPAVLSGLSKNSQ
jgi:hypothetical protein